jgi:ssDNA-binding Zn-finger/Zn-ribbon topoisomerase 1
MQQPTEILLALALRDAKRGIKYTPGEGAHCPWCGQKLRIMDTKPWNGTKRIRYQICVNDRCPVCTLDWWIKSFELAENMRDK